MPNIVVGLIVLLIAGGLFFGTYILNARTPVPEGCENNDLECESCSNLSCSRNKKENK